MENKAFDIIVSQLGELFTKNGFEEKTVDKKDSDVWQAVYANDGKSFRLAWINSDKKFTLDLAPVSNGQTEDYKNVSVWLFDPADGTAADAKSIANDFEDSAKDYISGAKQPRATRIDPKVAAKKKHNYMEFCRAACVLYPQFNEAFERRESASGEFNPDEFAVETLGEYMMDMLAQKKNAQLKKLFGFFNQSYETGDIDVQSIIMVTLYGMFRDRDDINETAEKYISENLLPLWRDIRRRMLKNAKQ
ncbi:MAG: hypothetical protein IKS19_08120 [Clostridia bacterium]|nr:hypothetical protein [Clostridia bacterium]